jgi:hypothetical protein
MNLVQLAKLDRRPAPRCLKNPAALKTNGAYLSMRSNPACRLMVALSAGRNVQDRREYFPLGSAQTSMFATVLNISPSPKRFRDARPPGFSEKQCFRAPQQQPVAKPLSGNPFQGRRKQDVCVEASMDGFTAALERVTRHRPRSSSSEMIILKSMPSGLEQAAQRQKRQTFNRQNQDRRPQSGALDSGEVGNDSCVGLDVYGFQAGMKLIEG